jgi:hypothetical protein
VNKTQFDVLRILLFLVLLSPLAGYAQTRSNMLLRLIEGNRYQLKDYDRKGALESSKKLEIGKIQKGDREIEVEIVVYNYDENSILQDTVRTRLACSNAAESMAMSLLAFLENSGDGVLKLGITSNDELFPADLSRNKKLKDIQMEVTVEKGVFSLFGAKSKITIRNRKLTLLDANESKGEKAQQYKLTSKMLIRAYALGINIKNIVFNVEETVDLNTGLIRQVARQARGGSFDLKLIDSESGG